MKKKDLTSLPPAYIGVVLVSPSLPEPVSVIYPCRGALRRYRDRIAKGMKLPSGRFATEADLPFLVFMTTKVGPGVPNDVSPASLHLHEEGQPSIDMDAADFIAWAAATSHPMDVQ